MYSFAKKKRPYTFCKKEERKMKKKFRRPSDWGIQSEKRRVVLCLGLKGPSR
jgi:hypothetical protein